MRRREFEVVCEVGIRVRSGKPGAFFSIIDKRGWFGRMFGAPRRTLYQGSSPADCYEWIERYRQAEKTAADFRG